MRPQLLQGLNHQAFKKLPGSRASQFEALDKPLLKPLPTQPYQLALFLEARVHVDYHVEVDKHYYSVPHPLIKQRLQVRLTANTLECFYNGQRVASHIRSYLRGKHTTLPEHMPPAHQKYSQWSSARFLTWALDIGPGTHKVIQHLLTQTLHPEQSYRSCFGILTSVKTLRRSPSGSRLSESAGYWGSKTLQHFIHS
jgi:transposase